MGEARRADPQGNKYVIARLPDGNFAPALPRRGVHTGPGPRGKRPADATSPWTEKLSAAARVLVSQEADIADSDVYADPAIYPDASLTDHIICVIPFTLIVAPGVPVLSLTHQQVIDIFSTGKIRNWKDVNGPNIKTSLETMGAFVTGRVTNPIKFSASSHDGMKGSRIYTIKGGKFTKTTGFVVP